MVTILIQKKILNQLKTFLLYNIFMEKTKIKFGTDGFRGIIAKDFTFETVEKIINAISVYLKKRETKKTVIVGYDPRFLAGNFARFCAELLKNYGFKVILSKKIVPTPIVAYCAKYYQNSAGAIMLTASHNPKEYQGIKFIPNYGGPAGKEITDEIVQYLDQIPFSDSKGEIVEAELDKDYYKHLEKLIDFSAIQKNPPNIIFDGLYSSSIGYFDKILDKYKIRYESYNMYHDCCFGGGLPEPKPPYLKHSKKGFITLANDGDADRYGVIDESGNYVHPNTILALLLRYLVLKGKKGAMIKTVGVSNLISSVCEKLNIRSITTPVGFKWLSEAMRNNETILAGEDSGGLSIGEHIPEKDGLLANLLIIEMISKTNKTLTELQKELMEFTNCTFYTDRVDIKLENDKKTQEISEKFLEFQEIANLKIKEVLTIDGIKFFLDDKLSSLLIRKSGTEPLLRFYIESCDKNKLQKIKEFVFEEIK